MEAVTISQDGRASNMLDYKVVTLQLHVVSSSPSIHSYYLGISHINGLI